MDALVNILRSYRSLHRSLKSVAHQGTQSSDHPRALVRHRSAAVGLGLLASRPFCRSPRHRLLWRQSIPCMRIGGARHVVTHNAARARLHCLQRVYPLAVFPLLTVNTFYARTHARTPPTHAVSNTATDTWAVCYCDVQFMEGQVKL